MNLATGKQSLTGKLKAYKKKYYVNRLLKGAILSLTLLLSAFLFVNSVEFVLRLDTLPRALLFFGFLLFSVYVLFYYVLSPTWHLLDNKRQISDEEAALQIGKYFPDINDQLLNTLQLYGEEGEEGSLIAASIAQRTEKIAWVPFQQAVNFGENKRYLRYLVLPSVIVCLILLFVPQMLTESSTRIIRFNETFVPKAPFDLTVLNEEMQGFRNEAFTLRVKTEGTIVPDQLYISSGGRRIKMSRAGDQVFEYTYENLREDIRFRIEANGFLTEEHEVKTINRPALINFNVALDYPNYTGFKNQRLDNTGNLIVPEGTKIEWRFNTNYTENLSINLSNDSLATKAEPEGEQVYTYGHTARENLNYSIGLDNEFGKNREPISYRIEVIPDEYPQISLEQHQDTALFSYIVLGGNISDDYGISALMIKYRIGKGDNFSSINIPFQRSSTNQSYYMYWNIDSLAIKNGQKMEYFVQVWDNDGINGRKSTQTGVYEIKVPSLEELNKMVSESSDAAETQLEKSLEESKELNEDLKNVEDRLKGKKNLNWEDKKALEELLEQKEKIEEEIKNLQKQNQDYNEKSERFQKKNETLKKKSDELKKLMDELLDEETKKLYEELQKLLQEQNNLDDIQEKLDQLKNKEYNMEKELERALEMFKRLKVENKLNEIVEKTDALQQKQEELAKETEDKGSDLESAKEKQDSLNQEFKQLQEEIEELEELNQDLKNPEPLQDTEEEEKGVEEQMEKSSEELDQKDQKKANDAQKKAGEEMKKLSEKMQQMAASMEMEMLNENLDNLRDIVDNLVKLSFDQEAVIDGFRDVNQSDPRFVTLSQMQLKLKDDAQIVEDSLLALAERVFQISSFVTREVTEMNAHMDDAVKELRDRDKRKAMGEQQLTMTSINNLAILLDDVLQQMQQQMADAMGMPSKQKGKKKGQMPNISQMQQQLNQQIEDLKKSGKSGREMSQQLAEMIAQQEQLRQSLEEMKNDAGLKNGGEGVGEGIDQIIKKMEETELDLANKRITEETIERQKEILTRMLEAEDALRERDQDDEREGQRPGDYEKKQPEAFEEYLKNKEREIELLKTVPAKLNPYYKKEVNEYFERIKENE